MTTRTNRSTSIKRTTIAIGVVLSVVVTGCSDSGSTATTGQTTTSIETTPTTPAVTTTTSDAPTTTSAATTTAPPTTTTDPVTATTWAVVLVAPDDVLNVRDEPLGEILFTLDPTERGIAATGMAEILDTGDRWLEVEFNGQTGWVNDRFITEEIDDASFASDAPGGALSTWAQTGSGPAWPSIVSPKGFHVIHFDPMKSWPPSQNPFLDQTVYDWGGEAAGPGQPVASDTFTNEIAASFAGVVGDPDLQTAVNQPLQGPESAPPFPPVQFQNFDYVAYHDPGDDPNVTGLDWLTWYVFFDWTGSSWTLVGMSVDGWAP